MATHQTGRPLIAIDSRLVGYAAGIARYATLLTQALVALEGTERYLLIGGRRGRIGSSIDGVVHRQAWTPPHHRLERWTLPLDIVRGRLVPDLLHSIDHVSPRWGPWRQVVTLHDLAFLLYPGTHTDESRRYYAATGESVRRAQRVIAVSQRTASDAVRLLGVDPARIKVVHEAAAPGFSPRSRDALKPLAARLGLDLDQRRPYILFVGTIEPRKNVPLLLDAFALLRRHLDAQLVLVGARGWLSEPIYTRFNQLGLGDHARFVGSLPEEDLAVLYSHAGVLALPSLYEGFGLTVLEAMACGAPVLSSNAGPLPEIAGDAAVLLPPHDASAWASALYDMLTNAPLADELRRRGFGRAGAFSWHAAALATRDVYREALLA